MERSAYGHSMGRLARGLVPSRASVGRWMPNLAIGFGCAIIAQIAAEVLSRVLGSSWPSWGDLACLIGGVVMAMIVTFPWPAGRSRDRKPVTPMVSTDPSVRGPS